MVWTHFWDMHSGGEQKLEKGHIFIEAPEEEARSVFFARFDRNPGRVTCTCCGEDYAVSEEPSLEQATAYQRGCALDEAAGQYGEFPDTRYGRAGNYRTLEQYRASGEALFIEASEIRDEERRKDLPEGYVWR